MDQYVLGIDIGTTCTKALLVDQSGRICGMGLQGYPLYSQGQAVEQRAEDWVTAVIFAIRQAVAAVNPRDVAALSCSTQGGSTVAVDGARRFIGRAWTWMDSRSIPEAKAVEEALGEDYVYHTTGWRIGPSFDPAKLRRMQSIEMYRGAVQYWTTLEVINAYLTGIAVIDPTNAAMRQLYHVKQGCWDETMLQVAGISEEALPQILPTGALVGGLLPAAAEALGLWPGMPVFNGCHDQYCASIGAGSLHAGDMLLSAGTTWVLMGIGTVPLFTDSFVAPGKHPVQGLYGAIASLVGSGASLQWYKDRFIPESFEELNRQAAQRRESARELFFYPYLSGAQYPFWIEEARGVFAGISLEHDRFDFARAIMEGAAFGVRRAILDFRRNGMEVRSITMMGGAAKSPTWLQMIASVSGVPILRLNEADVCALGAAMLAACGAGFFSDYVSAAEAMVRHDTAYEPIEMETVEYHDKFEQYVAMWEQIKRYYTMSHPGKEKLRI